MVLQKTEDFGCFVGCNTAAYAKSYLHKGLLLSMTVDGFWNLRMEKVEGEAPLKIS
jgi:hypothetical protein